MGKKESNNMSEKRDEFNKLPAELIKPKIEPELSTEKEEKRSKKNTIVKIIQFLNSKYDYRYNMIAARSEYKLKKEKEFKFFDERAYDTIRMEIILQGGFNISDSDFRQLIGSKQLALDYNPFVEFMNDLAPWDNQTDHIKLYLQQVQLVSEEKFRGIFIECFKKWFIGLVACMLENETRNDTCLVLVGEQGRRKTTFLNSLIPEELRLYYLYNGNFQTQNKDHEEMLATKMLINLDELATLNRTDIESLKSRITQSQVSLRRAYGRAPIHLWRRASFCGSINSEEFLTDLTGNRRWLPFKVYDIDLQNIDVKPMYSQAKALLKSGERFYFTLEEIKALEIHNESFRNVPMEEELILGNFIIPDQEELREGSSVKYDTTTGICNTIAARYTKINVNDSYKKKIGQALGKLGFPRMTKRLEGFSVPVKVWAYKEPINGVSFNPYRNNTRQDTDLI